MNKYVGTVAASLIIGSNQVAGKGTIDPTEYALQVNVSAPTLSGVPQESFGTGFIVDKTKRLVVTAAHVIPAALPSLKEGILQVEGISATLVCFDGISDLAVLQVEKLPENKKSPGLDYTPKMGDTYASALQNDKGMTFELQHHSTGAYLQIPMTLHSIGSIINMSNAVLAHPNGKTEVTKAEFIITDKPSKPGFSGGPAVNENGDLIGVQTRVDSSFGVLSSVRNVRNLLSQEECKGK